MNMNGTFFENGYTLVPDIINGDANSDLTGDWINTQDYQRGYIVLIKPSGTAGDDLSIAVQQATSAAGAGAKALTFAKLWHKIGTMSSTGTFTEVELTTATADLDLVDVNGTDLATDTSAAVVIVEVLFDQMDTNGGFKFVNVIYEGDDIANALVINSHWILAGYAYPRAVHLTALA